MNMFGRKKVELESAESAPLIAADPSVVDASTGPAAAVVHEIVSAPELSVSDGSGSPDLIEQMDEVEETKAGHDTKQADKTERAGRTEPGDEPVAPRAVEPEPEPAVVLSPEMQAEQDAFRAEVAELRAAEHAAFAAAIAEFEREQAEYAQVLAAFKSTGRSAEAGPAQNERAVA
jgi:hypothetical protein